MKQLDFMINSHKTIALLDTNVIYPIIVRDILFWFAYYDLFIPKWSAHIFDEWKRIMIAKGVTEEDAMKRIGKAKLAFPDALVKNYKSLIRQLELPDKDDCHVLAAAIKTNADLIITNNIKDFPKAYLQLYDLKANTADEFLSAIILQNKELAILAFKEMVSNKKNPKQHEHEVLNLMKNSGLKNAAYSLLQLL